MNRTVIKKGWMIFFLCLYVGLFLIATWKDLSISMYATSHAPAWYVHAGDAVGTAIPTCTAGVGCAGLYQCERREKKKGQWFWLLLFVLLAFLTGWLLFRHGSTVSMIIGTAVTAVIYLFVFMTAGKAMDGSDENIHTVCLAIIADVILSMVIVNVLKLIWARPRFIYMDDPQREFKAWYVINGPALVSDAYKSFPSAHTVSAGTSLSLCWLPCACTKLKDRKKTILVLTWIVILFVAVSRIFAGMHFLSDTLGGMGLAVLIYWLLDRRVCRNETKAVD
ncbi:MAG: phosphatase PAP2 family protein [Solobacterium sp.]|jgi:membrane-associated phospholipid phosphatase|nr:phosphatase PAP2 family protein [Solobacterium sp.]MCH4048153.1 phosphatase PAP2 family protein [Solobacterium sp.]MCH4074993.1 phosphatase PAP2 family protein [Solobacterium sp.]MCI1313595.1 phosphatase PAP2 family protein [Solobacterium sp.]MCI1345799.1 phosphatase PAP2 family protein [Solobacterium sp.]